MGENWQLLSPIRLSKSGCIWLKGVQNRHNGVIVWTQTELQLSRKTFFLFPLKRNTLVTFLHEIFIKLVTICVCVVGQVPWLCDSSCECIRIWQQVESPPLGVYWLVNAGWHLHRKAKILSPFSSLSPTPLLRSISFLTSLWHASCNTITFCGVMPSVSSVEEAFTFHSHIVPPWTSHLSPSCPFSFWNLQLTKHICVLPWRTTLYAVWLLSRLFFRVLFLNQVESERETERWRGEGNKETEISSLQ